MDAVFVGRFALVTRAHLTTVTEILYRWPRLTIAVLDLAADIKPDPQLVAQFPEFYRLCDANCAAGRNPFTAVERVQLWTSALHAAGLDSVAHAETTVRPELDPTAFNARFPADRYDLVTVAPTAACDRFDRIRTECFQQILGRRVTEIWPTRVEHTSAILTRVGAGARWGDYLPAGAAQAFHSLDGPTRLAARIASQHSA